MNVPKLLCLSLATGVLVLSGPAWADTKEDRMYADAATSAQHDIDLWRTSIEGVMTTTGKTHGEMLSSIKTINEKLIAQLRATPCKANDQAQTLEKRIHNIFHELANTIAPNITHAVNLSCSPEHKLVPTLSITEFTLKPSLPAAASKKEDAPVPKKEDAPVPKEEADLYKAPFGGTGEHMDAMLKASADIIARKSKPIWTDWANAIRPILKEPNAPDFHARLVQATAGTVERLKQVSCIASQDGFAGMSGNFQAATKDLNKDFPGFSDQFYWGYTFGLNCRDGKISPSFSFDHLKPK